MGTRTPPYPSLLFSLQGAMLKTLGPKVLALDKELVPWSTQSEATAACVPCLLLCFLSSVPAQKPWTPPRFSLSLNPGTQH